MKKYTLKSLTCAITSVMAMIALSTQSARAADTEIYRASTSGETTLMLLLDISGSMNLGYSALEDYNLTAGDPPQDGNLFRSAPTPILDAIAPLNTRVRPNRDNRGRYTQAWYNSITNYGRYTRQEVHAEWERYVSFSAGSYCQTSNMRRYRETGWQPTFIYESTAVTGRSYTREYCRVPLNANEIDNKFWANASIGSSWIMDPVVGCPMYRNNGTITTNQSEATHRRCYSRISRLKDALWDVLNGDPNQGIQPLDDKVVLGMSTLGAYLRNTGPVGWTPNTPLTGRTGWFHRNYGAIRVPARPLGEVVNGKTQRQHLIDFISDGAIFGAFGSTPTARSFAETVSYMLGTRTIGDLSLRETHMMNTANWAHRTCVAWAPDGYTCTRWDLASRYNVNSDINYIDGYPIPVARAAEPRSMNLPVPTATDTGPSRIYFGYSVTSGSGFAHSSLDSKKPDGLTYLPPESITKQVTEKQKECSGQGIYVLSDGAPSILRNEESTMKFALGSTHGATFTCGEDDWACMTKLSETILDPTKNPQGVSFKTAVVGFAREYADNSFKPYDPSLTKEQNLAGIPTNDNRTMARFARWGINGGGG